MKAITFINRKTNIPGWVNNLHIRQQRSFAYKKNDFCVSVYAEDRGLYVQSTGLTVSQKTASTIEDWVKINFDADKIETVDHNVGEVISGVWRPGLYDQDEINQALNITNHQRMSAEQTLYILIQRLFEILLYIEPSTNGLATYGHKTRELLILACTEVENIWKQYMIISGATATRFNTNDYVKLMKPLCLTDYQVTLKPYPNVTAMKPFATWIAANPTRSLKWYDAYNKTKHDRESHFNEATLENCIEAVAANIVMFCVRYGPFSLYHGQGITASHFRQIFGVGLSNPDPKTFYVGDMNLIDRRPDLVCGEASKDGQWTAKPLIL